MKFIVIGITDNPQPFFPPEVMEIIKNGRVFSGGKRHHEIVASSLPEGAEWIDITVPLEEVFEKYKRPTPPDGHPSRKGGEASAEMDREKESLPLRGDLEGSSIIVFASGDPLFFGFANTLRREFPEAEIQVFPTFNSLQMLAHRLVMPYHDMRIVSLTGRPWHEFDRALIERAPKIGILTDREHTPAAIAQRMLEYGYTAYTMSVGERLGNPQEERVTTLTLEEATKQEFAMPNCVILEGNRSLPNRTTGVFRVATKCGNGPTKGSEFPIRDGGQGGGRVRSFGIQDTSFALLDGREKMITKMPIRLLALQALNLPHRHVFWDIGACTGCVSIEACLLFPHLHIEAFEIRPECEAIITENARKFGALGIEVHIGDFLDSPRRESAPDAVFIGGHGGKLKEIMAKVVNVLAPGGVIVFNSVTSPIVASMTDRPSSRQLWDEACAELGLQQEPPLRIQLNDYNPIEILKATSSLSSPRNHEDSYHTS